MIDGLKLIGASLVILIAAPSLTGSNSTVIEITNQVIQPSVKRLGINLGSATSYDSGQIMKNLLFRNPGFEGEIYQSIIRCVSVTETRALTRMRRPHGPPVSGITLLMSSSGARQKEERASC